MGEAGVEGTADFQEIVDSSARIGRVEHRAVPVAADALEDDVLAGAEADDEAEMPQQRLVAFLGDDAAAGRDDARTAIVDERFQHGGLAEAKSLLAFGFENGGDRLAGTGDDQAVGVHEGPGQLFLARSWPTVVFPQPMNPMRTMFCMAAVEGEAEASAIITTGCGGPPDPDRAGRGGCREIGSQFDGAPERGEGFAGLPQTAK